MYEKFQTLQNWHHCFCQRSNCSKILQHVSGLKNTKGTISLDFSKQQSSVRKVQTYIYFKTNTKMLLPPHRLSMSQTITTTLVSHINEQQPKKDKRERGVPGEESNTCRVDLNEIPSFRTLLLLLAQPFPCCVIGVVKQRDRF